MQAHRVPHEAIHRVLFRNPAIERPIVRRGPDRDHRLDSRLAGPRERARERAVAREGFEVSVRVDEAHGLTSRAGSAGVAI